MRIPLKNKIKLTKHVRSEEAECDPVDPVRLPLPLLSEAGPVVLCYEIKMFSAHFAFPHKLIFYTPVTAPSDPRQCRCRPDRGRWIRSPRGVRQRSKGF